MNYSELKDIIMQSNSIAIVCHVNPDADTLASAYSMCKYVQSLNKNVKIFCEDAPAHNYDYFLKEKVYKSLDLTDYDLMISVDCNRLKQMGSLGNIFEKFNNTINIDHHITNLLYAKNNLVQETPSCSEIIYNFFENIEYEFPLDVALALYSGIAGDTGCFMHSNTKASSHRIAAKLMSKGIDFETANYYLFKYKTKEQLNLLLIALNSIEYFDQDKICIMTLTKDDLDKTHTSEKDIMGFVNYGIANENTLVSIIMSEKNKGQYKLSLRSKNGIDVSVIAANFGGGGHKYASGCAVYGYANSVKKQLLAAVREEICKAELS